MTVHIRSITSAVLLLLVGLGLTGWSYREIQKEALQLMSGPRIEKASTTYHLLQRGVCVGSGVSEYKLTPEGSSVFITAAVKEIQDTPIKGELSFNHLGQLMGAVFELSGPGGAIRFGSIGVDPIVAKINGVIWGKNINFAFPVPGPIELVPERGGFRLVDTRGRIPSIVPLDGIKSGDFEVRKSEDQKYCSSYESIQLPGVISSFIALHGGSR